MATEILRKAGTNRTWAASGGDEVLTLTSLASAAGRVGDGHDWGAVFPALFRVRLKTDFATAPTDGTTVDVYWASSDDNTDFDGQQAAGDAALATVLARHQLHWVGSLRALNNTSSQSQSWLFQMPARYGYPVVYNATNQALSATAGDHELVLTPLADEFQDV